MILESPSTKLWSRDVESNINQLSDTFTFYIRINPHIYCPMKRVASAISNLKQMFVEPFPSIFKNTGQRIASEGGQAADGKLVAA